MNPSSTWSHLLTAYGPDGDAGQAHRLASELNAEGAYHAAAVAWDRAYGLDPDNLEVRNQRAALLNTLAVDVYGLRFRYIPAGTFVMGSSSGDLDEAPIHAVQLDPYWLQEAPITWDDFVRIQGWDTASKEPPEEQAPKGGDRFPLFHLHEANKIRRYYCGDDVEEDEEDADAAPRSFYIERSYTTKPMVSVGWQDMVYLALAIEDACDKVTVDLPTEAEWERGARGGLIGRRYPWGDDPPTPERADFDHFGDFTLRPPRQLPPNGYGLYGMAGGVWEWCSDWYDAEAYARRANQSVVRNPRGPQHGLYKVVRGGSWADCSAAMRVSFRNALDSNSWRDRAWSGRFNPNVGARLVLRPLERLI
ncbi:MAG: SUMF1/EgtB/PvdO family nonheme iron enzyme [Myxococcota bacterium]